jgi:hypothetical protein
MWEQQPNGEREIDNLGLALSAHIPCPVRLAPYSNHSKSIFECACHKTFLLYSIREAVQTGDWGTIIAHHSPSLEPIPHA